MFVVLGHRKEVKLNPIIAGTLQSPVSLCFLCLGFRVEWVLVCKPGLAWE